MKRRMVCMLAMLLALSVCAVSAETGDAFPAITVTGQLTIDDAAVRDAMECAGLPADQIDRWAGILSLLSETRDTLVIANEGFEYSIALNGGEALSIAGETRDGRANLILSPFPSFLFTQEASDADWAKITEAAAAVVDDINRTLDAVEASVIQGTPEKGAFEVEGEHFDTRIPLNIDAEAVARAGVDLAQTWLTHEALLDAGLDTLTGYADLRVDGVALPAVTAACYSADSGEATLYTAELTRAGADAATVRAFVRQDGDAVRARVSVPDSALDFSLEYSPTEGGAGLHAHLLHDGMEYLLTADVQTGETAVMTTALYVNDMAHALATAVNTFALTGERTISIDPEGKLAFELRKVTEMPIRRMIENAAGE